MSKISIATISEKESLWKEITVTSQTTILEDVRGGGCRWVKSWGLVCETELDTITL
ncbi:MAG: hypothetical protein HC769_28830 [Cyanobacteria bacterium CRU_2_1]|nr:hypothetical protein [Cyanobacteria bacterium CRU_2_1]